VALVAAIGPYRPPAQRLVPVVDGTIFSRAKQRVPTNAGQEEWFHRDRDRRRHRDARGDSNGTMAAITTMMGGKAIALMMMASMIVGA